jgi:3'-5' exonuclease
MPRPFLAFDLETIPDPELPPFVPKEGAADPFPPPPFHKIVAIGAAFIDPDYVVRKIGILGEQGDEATALEELVALTSKRGPVLVSWNGRGFDLPVVVARCLRHGIPFPWFYSARDVRYRYSPNGHLDLKDFLVDYGAGRAYQLDTASKLIGLAGKLGCDGSDVAGMVAAGKIEEVRDYCLQDVAQTVGVFLRVQLLRGEITLELYRSAAAALLATIETDNRIAPLAARIRGRFLLRDAAKEGTAA